VSTQSIASTPRAAESAERCRRCGAALADDQRYCLECGERRAPASAVLLSPRSEAPGPARESAATQRFPPGHAPAQGPSRGNAVVLLAGIGVLMLAMGVGVLIGRSGAPSAGAPAVVTVATPAGAGGSASPLTTEFADDWPPGTSGYTVRLQSLPVATTTPIAVAQAKSAASAKGAPSVGALRSDDFSSLGAGSYDVYSGEYHTKAQAEKALAGLRKSFPGASVIRVSVGASGGSGAGASSTGRTGGGAAGAAAGAGGGNSATGSPAGGSKKSGRSYEQESKNLPNVVTTG
jgi:hypothetical protein